MGRLFLQLLPLVSNKHLISLCLEEGGQKGAHPDCLLQYMMNRSALVLSLLQAAQQSRCIDL